MLRHMRTTVRLPPGLMAQVKKLARETGRSMTEVIEDALRAAVARSGSARPKTVTLVTVSGNGLQPGVDLDDTSALLDRMDGIA
jgi:metal-responsive CopG/Arc/MetJ family transcriptional regulator